ncbi:MAG: hypothetical protein RMJ28_02625 [Nitrososphaerota archaeon]|nr:hypothetical protein [Candidatus Calditenuaceae archaeon]MDW8073117.1 hypothetical protein [Nitrososphaerota archaeon]
MSKRIEQIVPSIRAALADILVKKYGLRKSKVAKVLGVSPAAITHYVSGARGQRFYGVDKETEEKIEELAGRIARKISLGMLDSASAELNLLLNQLMLSRAAQGQRVESRVHKSVIEALLDRVTLEEEAAKRALELSSSASSQLAKMVLKQMAVDSMRHADILSTLIHILENNEEVTLTREDLSLIAEMSRFEERAEGEKLSEMLLGGSSQVMKALLTSIDMDEQKHEMLLKIILNPHEGDGKIN